ncbi:ferredoxin [Ruminococcaceae bacterium OttesenSCG-928-O06]|nr:ferredoxin [Ruminococcaceae bacterium OttesenSCG-928-O06]
MVSINPEACIGCGLCVETCAATFKIGGDLKAHVVKEPMTDHLECALGAAEVCPTQAIDLM